MKTGFKLVLAGLLLVAVALMAGCGGGGSAAASNATLALTVSTASVTAGGSLTATAKITSSTGIAVNNLGVLFKSNRPDLVHFATTVATNTGSGSFTKDTNLNGESYVVLNIDNSVSIPAAGAKVSVSAEYSGLVQVQEITIMPNGSPSSSTLDKITLSFDKNTIQVGEQSLLTGTLTDGSGSPVASQTVVFSAAPANAPVTITTINAGSSDSNGKVYALISATNTQATSTVVLTATATTATKTVNSSVPITINPSGGTSVLTASKIALSLDKTSLLPDQQALVTALVTDANNTVVPNQNVTLAIRAGSPLTIEGGATVSTGSDGKAYFVVKGSSVTSPTYALIDAATSTGVSQTLSTVVNPALAPGKPQLTLSIAKATVEPTDSEVLITAKVLDNNGAAVSGQPVTFSILSGPATVDATLVTVTTDINGNAISKIRPAATPFASNVLVSMQLTYQGTPYSLVATTEVKPAVNMEVSFVSDTLDTGGSTTATATVTTSSGVPVQGASVSFTRTGPVALSAATAITGTNGKATVSISPDTTSTTGNAIVEASYTAGGSTYRGYGVVKVNPSNIKLDLFVQSSFGSVYTTNSTLGSLADFTTTSVDGLTSGIPVKARFTYLDGTPIPAATITFTALDPGLFWNNTGGAVNGASTTATTTTSGEAYVVAVPGSFAASGFIHIQASTIVNGVTYKQVMPIAVQQTQLQKSLSFNVASVSVSPNVSQSVTGTFNLKDVNGIPITGRSVTFSILSGPGSITGASVITTDGAGNASVNVQAVGATQKATVYLQASVTLNGIPYNTVATFTVNPDTAVTLTTDRASVDANGEVVATATVLDANGNPVSGLPITFLVPTSNATILSAATTTNANGTALATIRAGQTTSTQNVLVQASVVNGANTYIQTTSFQINRGVGTLVLAVGTNPSSNFPNTAAGTTGWRQIMSAVLIDANGKPRVGIPVTLSVLSSQGVTVTIPNVTVNTDAEGKVIFDATVDNLTIPAPGVTNTGTVVWRVTTNDAISIIGYGGSTYTATTAP